MYMYAYTIHTYLHNNNFCRHLSYNEITSISSELFAGMQRIQAMYVPSFLSKLFNYLFVCYF